MRMRPSKTSCPHFGDDRGGRGAAVSSAIGRRVVVLEGGDQVLSSDIQSTGWQALARIRMLPGVKLGIESLEAKAAVRIKEREGLPSEGHPSVSDLRKTALTEAIQLCVSSEAGMPAVLDRLSQITGYAFEVEGTPKQNFSLQAKGTVEQVLEQISQASGAIVTLAR